jgi:hypothetical protein
MPLSRSASDLLALLANAEHQALPRKVIPDHLEPFIPELKAARLIDTDQWDVMLRAEGVAELARRTEAEQTGEWLTLAQVARGLGWFVGREDKRRVDSARVSRLGLPDNGKQGKARRVSRRALNDYIADQGLEWNKAAATKR